MESSSKPKVETSETESEIKDETSDQFTVTPLSKNAMKKLIKREKMLANKAERRYNIQEDVEGNSEFLSLSVRL